MSIKVFITDDHYMVIEGIRSLLQNEPTIDWMGNATNAASCLAFLERQLPDVLLLDINLPDTSGIELCKIIKQRFPSVFVLGLSTFNQQSFIAKMMEHGASGYLLKNATQAELLEAIQIVIKGKTYLSEEAADVLRKASDEDVPVITQREREVLMLIADGLTNAAIADHLFISILTVETHRKNLLAKFEVKNTASLIKTAAKLNLL
ncbi:MAG: response regulator transcription factor [Flavipsychrobacter sp.]|nr:response regulator transcription factor [Flavipsychrobacter sp.]